MDYYHNPPFVTVRHICTHKYVNVYVHVCARSSICVFCQHDERIRYVIQDYPAGRPLTFCLQRRNWRGRRVELR